MNEMIDGLLVLPGEDPVMVRFENSVKGIQKLIGGHFQALGYVGQKDWTMLCDDEGKLKKLAPNFWYQGDIIVGPALFVGINALGDDFDDLHHQMVKTIKEVMPAWREKMRLYMEVNK